MKGSFAITINTTQEETFHLSCHNELAFVSEADLILLIASLCDAINLSEEGRRVAADLILGEPDLGDLKRAKAGRQIRRCP